MSNVTKCNFVKISSKPLKYPAISLKAPGLSACQYPDLPLGSPLINGIFLVQKMCIYSCVTYARGPVQ